MKTTQKFLICLCLLGATQLAWSQVKEPAAAAIPGYLNPATGKFTTQVVPATAQQNGQATTATSTGIFFREDFQFTIKNYDQPSNATVYCSVEMSGGDTAGYYSESESVAATAVSGGWTCDVPVLTLWTLQNPTSATISASVSIQIVPQGTTTQTYLVTAGRGSTQSLTLTMPGNTQTVYNTVTFQI